jgi:hypothetical protein
MKAGTVVQLGPDVAARISDRFGYRTSVNLGGSIGTIVRRTRGQMDDRCERWVKPITFAPSNTDAQGRYMVKLSHNHVVLADLTEFTVLT